MMPVLLALTWLTGGLGVPPSWCFADDGQVCFYLRRTFHDVMAFSHVSLAQEGPGLLMVKIMQLHVRLTFAIHLYSRP